MKYLPLVLKNLLRKKTRSGLTVGSILLPFFVICILGTLLATLDADPSGGAGMYRIAVRHKVSIANFLPATHVEKIRQLPGVRAVTPFNWFGGQYVDFSAFNIFQRFGVDPEVLLDVFDEAKVTEGSAEEWKRDRSGAMVGRLLVRKYGWRLGQKVTLKGDIWPGTYEFTIRAIYEGQDESILFFNQKVLEERWPARAGFTTNIWIKADSAAAVERLIPQINALFENAERPVRAETEKEFQNSFIGLLGNVKLLVKSLAAIIALVILLIAGNTMAMAARERVTEIAVLRVLGFPKGAILGLLLAESVVLALAGAAAGLLLFTALLPRFRAVLLYSPLAGFAAGIRLFPEVLAAAFATTLLVGLLAGLAPAVRSARRSIVDGLRQVG
ncbi:MAG TPA: FtsX-like permease family protein [Thermoanaerobaculia bacterium]|nr:FtsX-like permease family protein [Thermoanaerobaculia bacterium]HQR66059.1 FtsX-like permease family protein [Thermoanaerobaculia bacterium]